MGPIFSDRRSKMGAARTLRKDDCKLPFSGDKDELDDDDADDNVDVDDEDGDSQVRNAVKSIRPLTAEVVARIDSTWNAVPVVEKETVEDGREACFADTAARNRLGRSLHSRNRVEGCGSWRGTHSEQIDDQRSAFDPLNEHLCGGFPKRREVAPQKRALVTTECWDLSTREHG